MRSVSKNRLTVSAAARAPASENASDLASPCCGSKEKSCFKENINVNKSGASSLCLEPQQMKKRKKGGKTNLRKSLAWDRAFSTEEGVLDPLELSALSGASCRGGLRFISEDTPGSSGQDDDFRRYKENDHSSSPMLDFSSSNRMTSTPLALLKVPTNAGSKLGSKSNDCPRPLPSPSLKRRANANVGKAASKELKLPKVPGLKPSLSPACATIRSTIPRGSHVKHNRIAQPDFSIQRDVEPKSSFKINNNTHNASRANTPLSARHSDGNLGCSSFNTSPMTVDKVYNSGPKTTPVNVTQIRPEPLENSCERQQYDSATFSQNAHANGRLLHYSQNQTLKPSGLRMPSPSLSFFSQPKPSVFRNLPLRDTDSYSHGSLNPGSLRLQDTLSRTTKLYDRIPDSRISSSNAICSQSESTAASHVSITDLVKPKLEQNSMYETQGPHKKKMTVKVSHEEAELQKIGTEVPSQNGSCEQAMDDFLKSESCGSEWRNAELGSKQNSAILESQTSSAIDEQYETKSKWHDSTQCTDGSDDRVQNLPATDSDWRRTSKQDCHEAHLEKTEPVKYSLEENERTDENISSEKERAGEKFDVSQQGIYCSESMKALGRGVTIDESPYFVSKQLNAIKVLRDNLPAAEPHMQNTVFASTVEGCKSDTNSMFDISNDLSQPDERSEVQDVHQKFEMESKQIGKLNIRDRLLAHNQLSLQNLTHEENPDELLLVLSDRKDVKKAVETKISLSLSLDERQISNLGEETDIAQPLRLVECDSVVNSFSSESCKSPISTTFYCDARNSYGNLSDYQSLGSNNKPLPQSTMHQSSPEDTLKKTEEVPQLQVSYTKNELTETMSLKDCESEINSLRGSEDSCTLLVQSSESNTSDNCCFQRSECSALAGDESVAENLEHTDDCVQTKHLAHVCSTVKAEGGIRDSIASQNEMLQSISRSSTPAKESPLKHEPWNDECETGSGTAYVITESDSDTIKVEVCEDTSNSLSCLHPKWNHDTVETPLLQSNAHGDGLEGKKSLSLVIPPNAIPFSDEWLAAMEAAGEDILTRKGGAVQNSPPDKPLPEPNPWSPVKKKNNQQIGPFDCTKKFTVASDS